MIEVKIRVFRAVDETEICQKYLEGHRNVLEIHRILQVTSNNDEWLKNPSVYAITAESIIDNELYGGIRVQKVGGTQRLPVEIAIEKMDPHISDLIRKYAVNGAGELCGLWNSPKVSGKGLSFLLTRMGISIVNQLQIKTMFGICAELTLPMFKKVGYEIEESLGDKGVFPYPRPDLPAFALIIKDTTTLEKADEVEREKIFELRHILKQKIIEQGPKGELYIEYDLYIPASWIKNS
jgi:hypothetical protein